MDALYAEILKLGLAGVIIVWLLYDRSSLNTRIKELEGDVKASQDARLEDLKNIVKDVTTALANATRVMETTAEESKASADNARTLGELVRAMKEGIDRVLVRP